VYTVPVLTSLFPFTINESVEGFPVEVVPVLLTIRDMFFEGREGACLDAGGRTVCFLREMADSRSAICLAISEFDIL
jgi:hypothetical protein